MVSSCAFTTSESDTTSRVASKRTKVVLILAIVKLQRKNKTKKIYESESAAKKKYAHSCIHTVLLLHF